MSLVIVPLVLFHKLTRKCLCNVSRTRDLRVVALAISMSPNKTKHKRLCKTSFGPKKYNNATWGGFVLLLKQYKLPKLQFFYNGSKSAEMNVDMIFKNTASNIYS